MLQIYCDGPYFENACQQVQRAKGAKTKKEWDNAASYLSNVIRQVGFLARHAKPDDGVWEKLETTMNEMRSLCERLSRKPRDKLSDQDDEALQSFTAPSWTVLRRRQRPAIDTEPDAYTGTI